MGWTSLKKVVEDTERMKRVLQEQGFSVEILSDARSEEMSQAIKTFFAVKDTNPNARLLLYYSGYGDFRRRNKNEVIGYLIPLDSPKAADSMAVRQNAISMEEVNTWSKESQARHVLFLFDACFSGLFEMPKGDLQMPAAVEDKLRGFARHSLTAGNDRERTPDNGMFSQSVEEALSGEADYDHDGYVTFNELGTYVENHVASSFQHPVKKNDPRNKGEFVFYLDPAKICVRPYIRAYHLPSNGVVGGQTLLKVELEGTKPAVRWEIDSQVLQGDSVQFVFPEARQYKITVTAQNQCGASVPFSRIIDVFPPHTAGVDPCKFNSPDILQVIPPKRLRVGKQLDFQAEVQGKDLEYLWDFGDGSFSTDMVPKHKYAKHGSYTLNLTARNRCGVTSLPTTIVVEKQRKIGPAIGAGVPSFRTETAWRCPLDLKRWGVPGVVAWLHWRISLCIGLPL